MILRDFRRLFVETTGRYDLVENIDNYKDNGADFYINGGQRVLDRLVGDMPEGVMDFALPVVRGQVDILTDEVKNIKEAYFMTNGNVRYPIYLRAPDYSDAIFCHIYLHAKSTGGVVKRIIKFNQPATHTGTLHIVAKVRAARLTTETSQSIWTQYYPETLVQAAWYVMERFYRNSEGMRDHLAAILEDLRGIDYDAAEQNLQAMVMKNSW